MYEKTIVVGWRETDANAHMANTAFLDKSADIRFMFFSEHGFPMEEFLRRKMGPVVQTDQLEYFREIRLMEHFRVSHSLAGFADDGSRYCYRNDFFRMDGKLAARITSKGGWLDLSTRKLIKPPEALYKAMLRLAKTDDFEVLRSSVGEP